MSKDMSTTARQWGQCQHDLAWLRRLFNDLHTAGFQIIEHSCWKACAAVPIAQKYPTAGPLEALPNELRLPLDTATGQATCLAALGT